MKTYIKNKFKISVFVFLLSLTGVTLFQCKKINQQPDGNSNQDNDVEEYASPHFRDSIPENAIEIEYTEYDPGMCFPVQGSTEKIFTNMEDYKFFFDSISIASSLDECRNQTVENLDFSKITLIGKNIIGSSTTYFVNIYKDTENKKIYYKSTTVTKGYYYIYTSDIVWAEIPVLEEGYSVSFITQNLYLPE